MILHRWRLLCLAVCLLPATISAQSQTITLEQAVYLTKQNSLQLELFRQEKLQKQGEAAQSRAWPNPQFRLSHEQLDRGTIDYHETTYQISQPLEILAQPFLRNKRSSIIEEAAENEFNYSGDLLTERVRMLYMEYWNTKSIGRAYEEALDVIEASMESAKARQAEGTYSGLDVQRFAIEFNKYNRLRNEIKTEGRRIKQELISLIQPGFENSQDVDLIDSFSIEPLLLDEEELIQYAIYNRADLNALEQWRYANELRYKIERRNRFPVFNLDFGYKNQADGAEGFVFGGSVSIPLFNQNRGTIAEARAGTRSAETSLQIQRQVIQNQIHVTVKTIEILFRQWEQIKQNPDTESMLQAAESAYHDGRFSLIELLDAAKAWLDDRTNRYHTISAYNKALFELDRMTSGMIISTQKTTEQ